jgi:hypothetical protein
MERWIYPAGRGPRGVLPDKSGVPVVMSMRPLAKPAQIRA